VSLICPFAGTDDELRQTRKALAQVKLADGDELLIADNRPHPSPDLVDASGPASSYFARQRAAERAKGEWLVFVDADTRPEPGLLDAYFDPPPADDVGVLAGAIVDEVEEDTTVARYITARRKLDQATTLAHPARPYAQTANAAVRRSAFEAVGGWPEPIRSGGDADLCWRLADAGWRLEERPNARVRHRNRASARALLAQLHRHGAGMAWLDQRWPGSFPPPTAREQVGRLKLLVRDRPAYAVLDVLGLYARDLGRLRGNR
jgi:GT2 family glycosyltransferase